MLRQKRRGPDGTDGLMGILTLQTMICIAALLICYGLRAAGGTLYENARLAFSDILARSVAIEEVGGWLDGFGGRFGEAKTVILSLFGVEKEPAGEEEEDSAPEGESDNTLSVQPDGDPEGVEALSLNIRTLLKITDATSTPRQSGGAGLTVSETSFISSAPRLGLPLSGEITSGFGYRIHPITQKLDYHTGVDIAAPLGTAVIAAADGVVVERGVSEINGRYILIRHNDHTETFYGHLSRYKAAEGDKVKAGDVIGLVGSTGLSTGPHLHFEIRLDGVAVDPETVLQF